MGHAYMSRLSLSRPPVPVRTPNPESDLMRKGVMSYWILTADQSTYLRDHRGHHRGTAGADLPGTDVPAAGHPPWARHRRAAQIVATGAAPPVPLRAVADGKLPEDPARDGALVSPAPAWSCSGRLPGCHSGAYP
jgi:hypothetical protein